MAWCTCKVFLEVCVVGVFGRFQKLRLPFSEFRGAEGADISVHTILSIQYDLSYARTFRQVAKPFKERDIKVLNDGVLLDGGT